MKAKRRSRLLSIVMLVAMLLTLMPTAAFAEDSASSTWTRSRLEDIKSTDTVAITMSTEENTWLLPTSASGSPAAVAASVEGDTLTAPGLAADYGWNITRDEESFVISGPNGALYIDGTQSNKGVRIGETTAVWTIAENGLPSAVDTADATRYMGVYETAPDWRAYKMQADGSVANVGGQTFNVWILSGETGTIDPPPAVTVTPIKDVLAASSGDFTVKGVVTLVDSKNIYVQDATGGICLYFASAPTDIALGDTVIGSGSRGVYNNLPELTGASYEKSEGMTLSAKKTTIGALTTADICTYVTLENLTVTSVSGTNINVKDADGNTIQIYKAVTGDAAYAADDVISFTGAVGVFKDKLQLRNTLAEEITLVSGTIEPPAVTVTPIKDVLAASSGDFTVKGVVTLVDSKNIYVQDATGGICLYFASAPTDIALGDTVIGSGSRGVYNNLPELTGASYEKSEGMTLSAKKTTIGALTTADICTYVTLENLTVTSVSGTNINVKDADGNTIQIYKAVTGDAAYAADDVISFTGAVGVYKDKLQLRNTLAAEIKPYTEPESKTGLVTDLADLTDGSYVVIYNPGNSLAMTSETYRDWYLLSAEASVVDGEVAEPAANLVWKVTVNSDGSYTFTQGNYAVAAWLDNNYVELTNNAAFNDATAAGWKLEVCNAENATFYMSSSSLTTEYGAAYVEVYGKKVDGVSGTLVFCGYSTSADKLTEKAYGMQFYLVPEPETPEEPDGLPVSGKQYVAYCAAAEGVMGLPNEMNNALTLVEATVADGVASVKNGALVFTVTKEGEDYSFECGGRYLATNDAEELFFQDTLDDYAKWYLTENEDGYVIYNRTAKYKNSPVCIEFFSGAFSGWTFKAADAAIFRFGFYPVAEGTAVVNGVAQVPQVNFDCQDSRYAQQDYEVKFTLDDLAPEIPDLVVTYTLGGKTERVQELSFDAATKTGAFTLPAAVLDADGLVESFTVTVSVTNSYNLSYTGVKTVTVLDEPFIGKLSPAANAQTMEDKRPVISAEIGNVGENAVFTMTVNDEPVDATYVDGVLRYQAAEDMADGRYTVIVTATRTDGKEVQKMWSFYVGKAQFQLYFGQLHSHTTYSDGSGSLESALEYIANIPESANIQFVAFTDHSNYFDSTSAPNPEAALYDASKMTADSTKLWNSYRSTVAAFNEVHSDLLAIAGFEMTWSGGPGHINTFNTPGIVSRNNATLNNKTADAGMKAYYATLDNEALIDSMSQFNHPGKTFGTFSDFAYWDAVTDTRMYLVEVGNGEGQIGAGGYYPSYEQYIVALDKGWHVAPTNNQDNHKGKWGNANDARDVIYTDDFTVEGLYSAIRQYRVYATEDKNLEIQYSVNGEPLGTIFSEVPEELNFTVTLFDPDSTDTITKVELVANSGIVAYSWTDPNQIASGQLEVTLKPDYSYYFVRVTQADGDLAVTAPVWVGESLKLGISAVECGTSTPVTGEEFTLTTTFFNSEASAASIKSIVYTVNGSEVIGTDTVAHTLAASSTAAVEFKYTPSKAKVMTITVTAVVEQDGKDYTFTKDIELEVKDSDALVYIGIDASHYNEYVAGNYKDSMGNFGALAAGYGVRTVELKTSEDLIAACSNEKYVAMIFTAPSRRLAAAQDDPRTYSAEELAAVAAFNARGGQVIVCGWSDYYENFEKVKTAKQMAETQNELLAALGSSILLGDDAVVDDNLNGGQSQRLYFDAFNFNSYLMNGVIVDPEHPNDRLYSEVYSNYGGCSVFFAGDGVPATVTPIVYGHATTYTKDSDGDGFNQLVYPYGDGNRVVVTASEQLEGKGLIIVSGAAFMSNFEVQATIEDNGSEKNYSNYKICENLVKGYNEVKITPIAEVQKQTEVGLVYTIEGTVTSNASGYDKDTAFFDCIYVQDETAGVCCFPVSGNYKIGDRVRITGYVDFYQAELELQVMSIEKLGETDPVQPVRVTAAQINDKSVLGSLVTLKGTVESFEYENGLVQTIMVKDAQGNLARVFIDGYITTAEDVKNLAVGNVILATGLSSFDDTWKDTGFFPRIRVRDRADIICADPPSAMVMARSLSLKGKIAINFYLDLNETVLNDENAYVLLNGEKLPVSSGRAKQFNGKTCYVFSTFVKLVQLNEPRLLRVYDGDDQLVTLLDKDGADVTETGYSYSARMYIEAAHAANVEESLLNLLDSLSDLGSLAQKYFDYDAANRVDVLGDLSAVTADTVKDYAAKIEVKEGVGIEYYGSSLLLREDTTVRHYFKLKGGQISQFTFTVDGQKVTPVQKGDYYYVQITNISARNLDTSFHVEVSSVSSGVVITIDYSAFSYAFKQLSKGEESDLTDLMKALVLYNQLANAYFD